MAKLEVIVTTRKTIWYHVLRLCILLSYHPRFIGVKTIAVISATKGSPTIIKVDFSTLTVSNDQNTEILNP